MDSKLKKQHWFEKVYWNFYYSFFKTNFTLDYIVFLLYLKQSLVAVLSASRISSSLMNMTSSYVLF